MKLTILADVEEDVEFWKEYCNQYNLELDPTFVYRDDTTSYNIRRVMKTNQVFVVSSFKPDRYYEKFAVNCSEAGIPTVILNSPMTYTFLDAYTVDCVTYDSDTVYPLSFNGEWYGIKTTGTFILSNSRPSGVLQPLYYQDTTRKIFAMRVFYRNFIFLNWTVSGNTLAAKDLFLKIIKGFKGVE